MRKLVSSGLPLEAIIGFFRTCRVGNIIAVAGTAPIQHGKTIFKGDVYNQTKYCLELSIQAVEKVGGGVADVKRTRIMLTDISH